MSSIHNILSPLGSYLKARKAYQNALEANRHIKPGTFSNQLNNINNNNAVKENTPAVTVNLSKNNSLINNFGTDLSGLQASVTAQANSCSFVDVFEKLTRDRIKRIRRAEDQMNAAVEGNANAVEVMAAVAESEMALQEIVQIRDKIISAYQEVLRMSL